MVLFICITLTYTYIHHKFRKKAYIVHVIWAGETLEQPSSTWKEPTRELEKNFLQGHVVTGPRVMALNWKRLDLD